MSGFSCAKVINFESSTVAPYFNMNFFLSSNLSFCKFFHLQGFLLEHKPHDAAGMIQILNQVKPVPFTWLLLYGICN